MANTRNLNDNEYLNIYAESGTTSPDTPQALVRELLTSETSYSVYDMVLPKNIQVPCITLQRISETIDAVTMLRRTTIQIDCYSESHPDADTIAEEVLAVLVNRRMETTQMTILSITPESTRDLSVPETRLFRVTGEYAVVWRKK